MILPKRKKTLKSLTPLNRIYNEDCLVTMQRPEFQKKVNVIVTSPPYNTSRVMKNKKRAVSEREDRYMDFNDNKTDAEYIKWTLDVFKGYNNVLADNGVILYNLSYSSEKPTLIWETIYNIIQSSDFILADTIVWKKASAMPNNVSKNKLTRITEFIFVICRKKEFSSFQMNKEITSISGSGQKYYENVYNFIEAPNNDGSNPLNKATFSSELVIKLLSKYARPNDLVYDNFIGTGTTALACKKLGLNYIGSEISHKQCEYSQQRLAKECEND